MKVHISPGNKKMGNIPSVSTPPGSTCIPDAPCWRDCYAKPIYRLRPWVKKCWDDNLARLYDKEDPDQYCDYFADIYTWLKDNKEPFFRWHVSGDIPDQEYFMWMCAIAQECRKTNFAVWTKRHYLDFSRTPGNLHVLASMWPEWGNPLGVTNLTRFWLRNKYEDRIPDDAIGCPDNCITCKICYTFNNPIDVWVKGKGQRVNSKWQKGGK